MNWLPVNWFFKRTGRGRLAVWLDPSLNASHVFYRIYDAVYWDGIVPTVKWSLNKKQTSWKNWWQCVFGVFSAQLRHSGVSKQWSYSVVICATFPQAHEHNTHKNSTVQKNFFILIKLWMSQNESKIQIISKFLTKLNELIIRITLISLLGSVMCLTWLIC